MSGLDRGLLADAAERITAWKHPLLLSHMKPDGDALGSLIAMRAILQSHGADPLAVLFDPIPVRYAVFRRYGALPVLGRDVHEPDLADADGVILLDTCSYSQIEPVADWLRAASLPVLAVDHHVTRDELADIYVIDERSAATCLILFEWARAVEWPIDEFARDAMFIGLAMDTGWFRFSNTDTRALSAAADLVARGAHPHELASDLFQRESPGRIRLLGAALASLELLAGGRLAVQSLTARDFADAGAASTDTEDIVNEPMRIESVVVSVLLAERENGLIGVSFRSKPPREERTLDLDVSAVAKAFGGGGHRRASAARVSGPLDEVRRSIVHHLETALTS
jgi:phosphoesterase RecJ-like protein